ncbi:MAG: trimeric autotransporter adhesin [Pseudonocardiales bacterium]|jgi:hypothetical protein|nr:trimeric autotransporter adhesin [Pseudonocardiales bacterium]
MPDLTTTRAQTTGNRPRAGRRSDWLRRSVATAAAAACALGAVLLAGPASAATPGVSDPGVNGPAAVWDLQNTAVALPSGWSYGVSALATGDAGTVGIRNGSVIASGDSIKAVPTHLVDSSPVTAVGVGESFAVALQDGEVSAWGNDPESYGVLNVPHEAQLNGYIASIAVGRTHALALTKDGYVLAWGDDSNWERRVPPQFRPGGSTHVSAIAAGDGVSLAVANGAVTGWGDGPDGGAIFPPPETRSHVVSVAAGRHIYAALRDDGTVIYWDLRGLVSVPVAARTGIVALSGSSTNGPGVAALRSDGTVIQWGYEGYRQSPPTPGNMRVIGLAANSGSFFGEILGYTPSGSSGMTVSINGARECATAWTPARPLTTYPCSADPGDPTWAQQQFFPRITDRTNGDFRVYSWLYNSCLTASGVGNGASVTLAPCTGAANQTWFKIQLGNGAVVVTNRAALRSIDTADGSTTVGAGLVVRDSTGTVTQQWAVNPAWSGI